MKTESIVVKGVKKKYGNLWALKGIDFRIHPGEIVGFLGPNGAGKTTTMKILTCFMAATEGEVKVAGFDVRTQSKEVRQRIGYLPENVPLYDEMLVYDYLKFVAELREVAKKEREERIADVARRTGIGHILGRRIDELSKGYRQRVGLAQAIIHEPEVIILDEPTTGLDPNQIIEIRDVIKEIGREKTIIFSTHILQEVTAVCDRIIIIKGGELVADGSLGELEERVARARPGVVVSYVGEVGEGKGEEGQGQGQGKPQRSREPQHPKGICSRTKFSHSRRRGGQGKGDLMGSADLRVVLEKLEGVERVVEVVGRGGEVSFRVEGSDDEVVRRAIIEDEAEHGRGLVSLRKSEPTLEDIFRLYTSEHEDEDQDEHENEDEHEHQDENEPEHEAAK